MIPTMWNTEERQNYGESGKMGGCSGPEGTGREKNWQSTEHF